MATIFIRPRREEGAERGARRQRRVSVFFESLRTRETAWATNLPFDDGRVVTPSLLASPHLQMTLLAFIVQFEEKGRLLVLIRTPL